MRMNLTLAAAAALTAGCLTIAPVAMAAPLTPPPAEAFQTDGALTRVAGGCGPGFFRGPYGGCRPFYGRRFYGRPFYGPRFYGPRCIIRPTPYGPRRFCR